MPPPAYTKSTASPGAWKAVGQEHGVQAAGFAGACEEEGMPADEEMA